MNDEELKAWLNRCVTCKWWDAFNRDGWQTHDCTRHAPKTLITTDYHMANKPIFPRTEGKDFCGDWEEFKPSAEKG